MLKPFLKEPLLHFLLIGAGLFFLHAWGAGPAPMPIAQAVQPSAEIVVTRADIDRLEETFTRTWGRTPSPREREDLIDSFVRDEIYYREARAMGLDREDTVIRRRMRQQMEFIFEDVAVQVEPEENELIAFMQENPERYRVDAQIAFRHVYLGDTETAAEAEEAARRIRSRLAAGVDPAAVSVPFLMGQEVPLLPLWDIESRFGDDFVNQLIALAAGRWEGPLRSPYGLHLVFIQERKESRLPALAEVRDAVERDLMAERQKKLKDEAYANLKRKYTIVIEASPNVAERALNGRKMKAVN
ncbi:MAG TPA: peptidylprolyl isomerase [Desulfosarcina sp.]|nr:peptidylprolyl isomerase [Desulfosarcina sp.]